MSHFFLFDLCDFIFCLSVWLPNNQIDWIFKKNRFNRIIHSQPLSLLRGVYLVLWRSSGVDCTASLGGTRGPVFSVSWSHSPDSEWAGQREVGEEEGRVSVSAALGLNPFFAKSAMTPQPRWASTFLSRPCHSPLLWHPPIWSRILFWPGEGVCVCVCAQCLFVLVLWE